MTETLVKYIEAKGFTVLVQPDMLNIYKYMDQHRTSGRHWYITQTEIERTPIETIYQQADEIMRWIETQIAQVI